MFLGLACEGVSDHAVIENVISGLLENFDEDNIRRLQPHIDETTRKQSDFGGWTTLLNYLTTERFEEDLINCFNIIIHFDSDISTLPNFDVPHKDANVDRMVISNIYFSSNVIDGDGPYLYTNGQYIYIDGKWANIIKNTPVTIGEYPAMWNTSRTILEVGCKSYKSSEVLELYLVMKKLNISEIRIERHTVTYSQVLSLIKQLN